MEATTPSPAVDAAAEVTPTHAVLYTDGGCRSAEPKNPASRGQAGWGMHGYLYHLSEPKVGAGAKKGVPSPKGYDLKASGKGTITVLYYIDAFHSIPGEATNQVAELTAACEAVKLANRENLQAVTVITDSKYVVDGSMIHMHKWKNHGWRKGDGQAPANLDLWQTLDREIAALKARGGTYTAEWVKGHNGDPGNVLADRYATRAVLAQLNGRMLSESLKAEAKGYWKAKYERNRMLSLANWYFTTSAAMDLISPDGRHVYYIGDIRDSEEFTGKRISDASFAVVYLKQPEFVLDQLYSHFRELSKGTMQGLISADLRTIFHADIFEALHTHGDKLLLLNRQRQSVEHMDKLKEDTQDPTILGKEIRPTRRAYAAVNILESLEITLNNFLSPPEGSRLVVTEITDVLYEQTVTKTKTQVKLSPAISTSAHAVDVEARYPQGGDELKKLCLTLGQDLPDRNTLAALACEGIKVHVVTWPESASAFRFATVIEANGDTGIWSGPYANLQLIDRPA